MGFGSGAKDIEFNTGGADEVVDITAEVAQAVSEYGLVEGIATVFVVGSTASVTTLEYEPGLETDIKEWLRGLAPEGGWQHDAAWSEANGQSHLRASIIGPSLTVPVAEGQPVLGTWQQIVVIDHDVKPRRRRVVVQMVGEMA
jgi:secondary thiamine-phosphate synthase enzyme